MLFARTPENSALRARSPRAKQESEIYSVRDTVTGEVHVVGAPALQKDTEINSINDAILIEISETRIRCNRRVPNGIPPPLNPKQ